MELKLKEIGKNERFEMLYKLTGFVINNWSILWEGAARLDIQDDSDCYCPYERIQINNTRLHSKTGVKYADNHKYNREDAPTEEELKNTIKDIQELIDEAAKHIKCSFKLTITNN